MPRPPAGRIGRDSVPCVLIVCGSQWVFSSPESQWVFSSPEVEVRVGAEVAGWGFRRSVLDRLVAAAKLRPSMVEVTDAT